MTGRRWARRRRTRGGARGSARARLPRRCRRAKKMDEKTHERELGLGRHVVVARGARRALLVDGRALRRRVLLDVLLRALEHARACEKDNRRTASSNACGRSAALRAARPARLAALARGGALPRHSRRVRAAAFSTLRFAAVLAASASRALRFFSTLSGTNLQQGGRGQQGQAARWWRAVGASGTAARAGAPPRSTQKKQSAPAVSPTLQQTRADAALTTCSKTSRQTEVGAAHTKVWCVVLCERVRKTKMRAKFGEIATSRACTTDSTARAIQGIPAGANSFRTCGAPPPRADSVGRAVCAFSAFCGAAAVSAPRPLP